MPWNQITKPTKAKTNKQTKEKALTIFKHEIILGKIKYSWTFSNMLKYFCFKKMEVSVPLVVCAVLFYSLFENMLFFYGCACGINGYHGWK